jgi:hypothetical protein
MPELLSDDEDLYHEINYIESVTANKSTFETVLSLINSVYGGIIVMIPYFASKFGLLFTLVNVIIIFLMS